MAGGYFDLKEVRHMEDIKQHISNSFRMAKIITDFAARFSASYDNFAADIGRLTESFQQKTNDFCAETAGTPFEQYSVRTLFGYFLSEITADVKNYADLGSKIQSSFHKRLSDLVNCKKTVMNQLFNLREGLDKMLDDSVETLHKSRVDLRQESQCYDSYRLSGAPSTKQTKEVSYARVVLSHNEYITQLDATNRLIAEYNSTAVPYVLTELEDLHKDLCTSVHSSIQSIVMLTATKAENQLIRYETMLSKCTQIDRTPDIANFVKLIKPAIEAPRDERHCPHSFTPCLTHPSTPECLTKGEIIVEKCCEAKMLSKRENLTKESLELDRMIKQAGIDMEALQTTLNRLLTENNFLGVYETQMTVSKKKTETCLLKLRLSVVRSQLVTLGDKTANDSGGKKSGIKEMWKKFASKAATKKSKDRSSSVTEETVPETKSIESPREESAPADTHQDPATTTDPVYNLLKSAAYISKKSSNDGDSSGVSSMKSLPRQNTTSSGKSEDSRSSSPAPGTKVVPVTSKHMLNERMKSFSLDAPDSPHQVDQRSKSMSLSYTNYNCISGANLNPTDTRRLHIMTQNRGLIADAEDSPVKPQGVLSRDTNGFRVKKEDTDSEWYIALYDFYPREPGDLPLRANDRVKLNEMCDSEWWLGSCQGRTGYFPLRYVMPLKHGQRVFQVCRPVQLQDGNTDRQLLRDQIVVQCGRETNGMILVETSDMKSGRPFQMMCALRYLQEI